MYLSSKKILIAEIRVLKLGTIASFASMLAIVIDVEVAEIKASFLAI